MGRRARGRPVDGILLLDKPGGLTSNQSLQRVKRLFDARKAGHTGSLDPLATGLLPLCLGHATKVSAFLLDSDKRYEVTAQFGARTDTADAQGQVTETSDVRPDRAAIDAAMTALTGPIEQIPPMYSALKHKGQRLYSLAREGKEVERPPRAVTIHEFVCTVASADEASFEVQCSKGTYIRTLMEDLAARCGTLAHVTRLRRTAVGPFDGRNMLTLEELEQISEEGGHAALDARLARADTALGHWPAVELDEKAVFLVGNGQTVTAAQAPPEGTVRLYAESGDFLGLGEALGGSRVAPKRLFK
ncbi:MAG: tRNA pseudouridine(55) synthase TruB [Gammaproteobacteria bacterium]